MYINDVLWCLIKIFAKKYCFEKKKKKKKKRVFNKIPFLHKMFHGDFRKEITTLSTRIIHDGSPNFITGQQVC